MEIPYQIVRSRRRTVALEITRDARLVVRLPLRGTDRQAREFLEAHADWARRQLAAQEQRLAAHPEPTETERAALIARAKSELPPRIARYARLLGVTPTGLTITGAKTRFGSCSFQNRLSFSWRLMQYPDEAVDYVVVHELCHILHKNHGPDFYREIAGILPDYRSRIELLRR